MKILTSILMLSLLLGITAPSMAQPLSKEEALKLGKEAYVYGYPLVTMEMSRRVMTNVQQPAGTTSAPMGQIGSSRKFIDASYTDVVSPNADTLYSFGWLDLKKEPYVLTVPKADNRYYLLPMLNGWTDIFAVPGTRTTGNDAQTILISGPNWNGVVPKGMSQIKMKTNMFWMLGRIYCSGTEADYKKVHDLQDELKFVPLSQYGNASYAPPKGKVDPSIDMKTPVQKQVDDMDAKTFFNMLANLMVDNPPYAEDKPMLSKLAQIGITPGSFDASKIPAELLEQIHAEALKDITTFEPKARISDGWIISTDTGKYGTDYMQRAYVAWKGLGANLPEDAIYPYANVDTNGQPLNGANKYTVTFPKGGLPPVEPFAFWSLTMYDNRLLFVDNPINRYRLSSADKFLYNKDGSVTFYVQNENPGKDKEANWLPAPKGAFNIMLRTYSPKTTAPSIIDGSWNPPGAVKVN